MMKSGMQGDRTRFLSKFAFTVKGVSHNQQSYPADDSKRKEAQVLASTQQASMTLKVKPLIIINIHFGIKCDRNI